MALPPIYLITDRRQLPSMRKFLGVLEELLGAGLRLVQLREKDLNAAELWPLAEEIRRLTSGYACQLLINDRIDLALAIGADGVHLGGHSLPTAEARKLLGPNKLIGVSTHHPDEIAPHAAAGADFVTFGPVFPTPSKAAFGEPVGLENLQNACQQSPIPVYALGGIKTDNCRQASAAGASGIAMISALLCSFTPVQTFHLFSQQLSR